MKPISLFRLVPALPRTGRDAAGSFARGNAAAPASFPRSSTAAATINADRATHAGVEHRC